MSYERGPSIYPLIIAAVLGSAISGIIRAATTESTADKLRDVQIANEQLLDQLDRTRPVAHLIVNLEDNNFTFNTQSSGGGPETCAGKYETQNKVAHVVGDLTCSQTVPGPN